MQVYASVVSKVVRDFCTTKPREGCHCVVVWNYLDKDEPNVDDSSDIEVYGSYSMDVLHFNWNDFPLNIQQFCSPPIGSFPDRVVQQRSMVKWFSPMTILLFWIILYVWLLLLCRIEFFSDEIHE
jgi:hypothetical protein